MNFTAWNGFKEGVWTEGINVRDFIDKNYTPYTGDASFLKGPTDRTRRALARLEALKKLEQERGGVLAVDTSTVSSLCNYEPGYLTEEDLIVGLQTDEPLKRGVNPFGGIRMARAACEAYGYKLGDEIEEYFTYRTTHNDGVFRVYTDE
ncbi:MAG: formate acetyltransferase, partial [Lachnospiraceae bacterium]|nr:formate acetyltransferase [Lachnospiraceae bacterium]